MSVKFVKYTLISCLVLVGQVARSQEGFFTSFDGTRIHYEVAGDGRPVVLLHGFTNDGKYWKDTPVWDGLLAAHFKVIIPDTRGSGLSDKPHTAGAYSQDAEAKDVMGLVRSLGIEKYSVVGYSRGSIIAARILVLDKQAENVVLGGMGEGFTDPEWPRRLLFYQALIGDTVGVLEPLLQRVEREGFDRLALAYQQKEQPSTTPNELAVVKKPVLIVCGDHDEDNGSGRVLSTMIPGSQFAEVPGDHNNARRTSEFAHAVLDFLKAH